MERAPDTVYPGAGQEPVIKTPLEFHDLTAEQVAALINESLIDVCTKNYKYGNRYSVLTMAIPAFQHPRIIKLVKEARPNGV